MLQRDVLLAARRQGEVLTLLGFFLMVTSLFPLGLGADPLFLQRIAPGVIWVCALLATLLGLPRLFASDWADGSLEQMALSAIPLLSLVWGKVLAHWLVCGMPLVLLSPLIGLMFALPDQHLPLLMSSLLLGTPVLSCLGAIGAALTLGVRQGHVLLSVLVLPLCVPVLIFGAGAVVSAQSGLDADGYISLLAALLLLSLTCAPWAASAALKIALE
jgi:heme exporter protein B